MPYKVTGKTVLVKRGSRWVPLKRHPSEAAAKRHLRALRLNVRHTSGRRRSVL